MQHKTEVQLQRKWEAMCKNMREIIISTQEQSIENEILKRTHGKGPKKDAEELRVLICDDIEKEYRRSSFLVSSFLPKQQLSCQQLSAEAAAFLKQLSAEAAFLRISPKQLSFTPKQLSCRTGKYSLHSIPLSEHNRYSQEQFEPCSFISMWEESYERNEDAWRHAKDSHV
jgi:hypothetical protein